MVTYDLKTAAQIMGGTVIGEANCVFSGITIDTRNAVTKTLYVPIIGERLNGHQFVKTALENGAAASLWQIDQPNRPTSGNFILVKDTASALHDLGRFYRRQLKTKIIGITGSVGKTSTKDIVAAVLKTKYKVHKTAGNFNNLLGVPQTILAIDQNDDYAVCELGLQHPNDMASLVDCAKPDMTIITSIAPCHIEYFHSLDGIVAEKSQIISELDEKGICYYNHQAYGLQNTLPKVNSKAQLVSYGLDSTAEIKAENIHYQNGMACFATNIFTDVEFKLPLLGNHQIMNCLPAIAIGKAAGLTAKQIQQGLSSIQLTPHRLQVRQINQAIVIDDAYNSNPLALTASLQVLAEYPSPLPKIAVLGDMLELGEHQDQLHAQMAEQFDFSQLQQVYLYGPLMKNLDRTLQEKGISSRHFDDLSELTAELSSRCRNGCIMLVKASNGMHFIGMIQQLEEQQCVKQ